MIKYPFAIISDIHCHDWSSFSYIQEDKVNSRLQETLDAIEWCVHDLLGRGGEDLVVTGDLFHTRGKLKPSVFNPVFDLFTEICKWGIKVWMLPGNHDLENKDSDTIGNVIHAFSAIPGCTVFDKVTTLGDFVFIPWIDQKEEFVRVINEIEEPKNKTIFCHIGIDGVLDRVAGKVGKVVLDRGFKNVFSGDYHNHKPLGNGIYSVGALTHHSFGDIDSRAGYLIVHKDKVEHYETSAPKFVDADDLSISGNIVRLQGEYTEGEVEEILVDLKKQGAKYIQDLTTRPTIKEASLSTTPVRVDLSLDSAIESYIKKQYGTNYAAVLEEARRIKDEHV